MRNLKKLLAILLAATMLFSFGSLASAAAIKDAPDAAAAADVLAKYGTDLEKTYTNAVQLMVDLGVVVGDDKGNLNLGKIYNRAEFAAMLYKSMNGGSSIAASYTMQTPYFKDVPSTHWAVGYANWGGTTGLFAGYGDGLFGPNDQITFEQGLLVTMKALGLNTKTEGLDGLAWGGPAEALVRNLAFNLGILGSLVSLDGKYINRAEACLLNEYFIRAEQIRYSVITGERYRTGDEDNAIGVWGQNDSSKLINTKFGLVEGAFTVISDGAFFALETQNGSDDLASATYRYGANPISAVPLTRDGRAVIQKPKFNSDGTSVESYDTYFLSAEDTTALGIKLEDVGRKINLTFRKPSEYIKSIPQLFGNMSYADKVRTQIDVNGYSDMTKTYALIGDVAGGEGLAFVKGYNIYDTRYYVNYSNDIAYMTARDGQDSNPTATAVAGVGDADAKNINFHRDGNWNYAKFRVVYDKDYYGNDIINYVFVEFYNINKIDKVTGGKMYLQNNNDYEGVTAINLAGNRDAHEASTDDVYGYEKLDKGARVLTYKIGKDGLFGMIKCESVAGKVGAVSANSGGTNATASVTLDGKKYTPSQMKNWLYNGIKQELVGKDITLYLANGFIAEIASPDTVANYCLVTASGTQANTDVYGGGSNQYWVRVVWPDGTSGSYKLGKISSAAGTEYKKINPAAGVVAGLADGQYGSNGGSQQISLNTNATDSALFQSGRALDGYIFECSGPSGDTVDLKVVKNLQQGTTGSSTGNEPGTNFGSSWGSLLNGKFIKSSSVTFVRVPDTDGDGADEYKVYTGQTIPSTKLATGNKSVALFEDLNVNDAAGNAIRVAYIETDGLKASKTNWAIALAGPARVWDFEKSQWNQAIDVLLPDGTTTTLQAPATKERFNNITRSTVFDYYGPATDVDSIAVNYMETAVLRSQADHEKAPSDSRGGSPRVLKEIIPNQNALGWANGYQGVKSDAKFYFVDSYGYGWFAPSGPMTISEAADTINFDYLANGEASSPAIYGATLIKNSDGDITNVIITMWAFGTSHLPLAYQAGQAEVTKTVTVKPLDDTITLNITNGGAFANATGLVVKNGSGATISTASLTSVAAAGKLTITLGAGVIPAATAPNQTFTVVMPAAMFTTAAIVADSNIAITSTSTGGTARVEKSITLTAGNTKICVLDSAGKLIPTAVANSNVYLYDGVTPVVFTVAETSANAYVLNVTTAFTSDKVLTVVIPATAVGGTAETVTLEAPVTSVEATVSGVNATTKYITFEANRDTFKAISLSGLKVSVGGATAVNADTLFNALTSPAITPYGTEVNIGSGSALFTLEFKAAAAGTSYKFTFVPGTDTGFTTTAITASASTETYKNTFDTAVDAGVTANGMSTTTITWANSSPSSLAGSSGGGYATIAGASNSWNAGAKVLVSGLAAGAVYQISAKVNTDINSGGVTLQNSSGTRLSHYGPAGSAVWTQHVWYLTIPAGTEGFVFNAGANSGGTFYELDDVVIIRLK